MRTYVTAPTICGSLEPSERHRLGVPADLIDLFVGQSDGFFAEQFATAIDRDLVCVEKHRVDLFHHRPHSRVELFGGSPARMRACRRHRPREAFTSRRRSRFSGRETTNVELPSAPIVTLCRDRLTAAVSERWSLRRCVAENEFYASQGSAIVLVRARPQLCSTRCVRDAEGCHEAPARCSQDSAAAFGRQTQPHPVRRGRDQAKDLRIPVEDRPDVL